MRACNEMIPCSKAHDRSQMVPEEPPRIAQRFNAGLAIGLDKVPKGRLKSPELVQPSLRDLTFHHSLPSVETLGYFHYVPPGHHFVARSNYSASATPIERMSPWKELLTCSFVLFVCFRKHQLWNLAWR